MRPFHPVPPIRDADALAMYLMVEHEVSGAVAGVPAMAGLLGQEAEEMGVLISQPDPALHPIVAPEPLEELEELMVEAGADAGEIDSVSEPTNPDHVRLVIWISERRFWVGELAPGQNLEAGEA